MFEQKTLKPMAYGGLSPHFGSDIPAMLSFEFLQHEVHDELQLAGPTRPRSPRFPYLMIICPDDQLHT